MSLAAPTSPGDLMIFLGGRVHTGTGAGPATALAIADGRITAVGTDRDIAALAGPGTRVVQLRGRTVVPGLIDSHCHVENAGMGDHLVPLDRARTLSEALDLVATHAATLPPDAWVRGGTWNPALQLAEGHGPSRDDLDRVAGGRPVFLPEGHAATASTAALRTAGIDPDGHDGRLVAEAMDRVARAVPAWAPAERAAQFVAAQRVFASHGITSVVAGALPPTDVDVLRDLATSGTAPIRVAAMVTPTGELNPSVSVAEWKDLLGAGPPADVADRYRTRGVKLQIDGGMTLGSAATRAPYRTDPGYHGTLVVDPERFTALVETAHAAGWPVGVHVVGDAAIDLALDAYARTRPADLLPDVLIHASLIQPDQIARARALGVHVAAQAPFLWRNRDAVAGHLGHARADGAVPFRSLLDGLGPDAVAAGTDYPINALDPWQNLYAMSTRRDAHGAVVGPEQAVTRAEALHLLTAAGAAHTGEQALKGRLAPGMLADLAVLDTDPLTASDDALRATRVLLTVVGGRVVHDTHDLED